jgi:NADPH-dependent 2,4-dienoyl-CoA reductase/sulfur reductase-like enzyme
MVSLVGGITAAVVVGGGLLGMNLAQSLRERGLEVNLLVRDERLWAATLDQIASKIIAKRLEQEGVQVNFTTEIEKVIGMSEIPEDKYQVDVLEVPKAIPKEVPKETPKEVLDSTPATGRTLLP